MKTKAYITMNELVFENRNQSYGAYYLRTHYSRIAATSTSVALLILFLSWTTPLIIKKYFNNITTDQTQIKISGIFDMTTIDTDPVKIDQPQPPKDLIRQIAFIAPQVTRNVTTDVPTQSDFDSLQAGRITVRVGVDPGSIIDSTTSNTVGIDVDIPILNVSVQAEYPGGARQLYKDLSENLVYPESSSSTGIEGKVYLKFVVGKNGKIRDVEIARSNLDEACNQAAIKALNKLSDWKPAENNGYTCSSYFYLPIEFKLSK
jgi:periplasmic protein TonB